MLGPGSLCKIRQGLACRTPQISRSLRAHRGDEAESQPSPADAAQGTFQFVMKQSIPPYLIALAVGDLAFEPLGSRTGVWAEPGVVKVTAHEFADVEKMVQSAEKQFGPYRWGRYDLLVLPPSFPFGGMENPRLTFATPTVLAGDRSLVSLVAHKLAHSWSGNLVTNATWRNFWLNEGFTTYLGAESSRIFTGGIAPTWKPCSGGPSYVPNWVGSRRRIRSCTSTSTTATPTKG